MALSEAPVAGIECGLFYNTGTYAVPTWVDIAQAINVSYSLSVGEADQSSRSSAYKKSRVTLKELEFTFTYRKLQGADAVFDVLRAAVFAGTVQEYLVLDDTDDTLAGAQGPRAFCSIFGFNGTQDLESTEEVEFTLKPSYYDESGTVIDPAWLTVV